MKISDTSFLKTTSLFYQPLPLYGNNMNPLFSKTSKTQTTYLPPPPLFIMVGGSNYVMYKLQSIYQKQIQKQITHEANKL